MAIPEISLDDLVSRFDPDVHEKLRRLAVSNPTDTHLVLYENQLFDSSQFGARSALIVGPQRSTPTLEVALAGHLGHLASDRKEPVAYTVLGTARTDTTSQERPDAASA